MQALLEQTAKDLGPPGKDPQFGSGLVDAGKAVAQLTVTESVPLAPSFDVQELAVLGTALLSWARHTFDRYEALILARVQAGAVELNRDGILVVGIDGEGGRAEQAHERRQILRIDLEAVALKADVLGRDVTECDLILFQGETPLKLATRWRARALRLRSSPGGEPNDP